jgi:4-amino-4-deoxy-L-arabinose transferase-like glycosyltransferase
MSAPDPTLPRRQSLRSRTRPGTLVVLGLIFMAAIFAAHAGLLSMPYFWDEVGHFVPAALDVARDGALVPHSVPPGAQPPGLSLWLALWWKVAGHGALVTRVAMLAVGGLALLAAFLLAVELCGSLPGIPAVLAVLLLAISPLFYTQSLLAQPDVPAALFTALGLYAFLRERHGLAVAACVALALVRESGVVLAAVLLVWLAAERRWRVAALYLAPVAAFALWLGSLKWATGSWLGGSSYVAYNVTLALRPSHIAIALARRLYSLFVDNLHWVGSLAIVVALRSGSLNRRRWKVAAAFAVAHLLAVSLFGGASLERLLVPLLPLFYAAAVVGLQSTGAAVRWLGFVLLAAGLAWGLVVNPRLWPSPLENNLAMADYASLQLKTARWLETHAAGQTIATAWPLSDEIARPDLGFVSSPLRVWRMGGFSEPDIAALPADRIDLLVRFSLDSQPPGSLLDRKEARWFARRYLGYSDPAVSGRIAALLRMKLIAAFEQGGHWVEVYGR